MARHYKRYLTITLNSQPTKALVDSGNVWRSAISRRFLDSMGMGKDQLRAIETTRIGTAKKGAQLTVEGELKTPLKLRIPGLTEVFTFQPIVVSNLTMDVNLSGPWLKKHGWDQIHTQDCIRIGNSNIPLHRDAAPPMVAFLKDTVIIPGHTGIVAEAVVPGSREPGQPAQGYYQQCTGFTDSYGLAYMNDEALVNCDISGICCIFLINQNDVDITIKAGKKCGSVQPMQEDEGIMSVSAALKQEKRDQYLRRFLTAARKDHLQRKDPKNQKAKDANDYNLTEKRAWMNQQFELPKSPFIKSAEDLKAAQDALIEFWDLFSHDGSYGKTDLVKHRIITEDVPPIKSRYRPINPALEPDLRKQLDTWLSHDVIEPSNSPLEFQPGCR